MPSNNLCRNNRTWLWLRRSRPRRLSRLDKSLVPPNLAADEKEAPVAEAAVLMEPAQTGAALASAPALAAALGREGKAAAMTALRERAMACVKCPHLVKSRRTVVFGTGDIHARLMFVGEAPGADEDARGEPFVGAARPIVDSHHQGDGFHARDGLYRQHIEVPARHARAKFWQSQTDAGGNENLPALVAGAN